MMSASPTTDFTRRTIPSLGKSVFRLGLACNMGIDAAGFEHALDRGVDYVFWTSLRTGKIRPSLSKALAKRRENVVVASGPTMGYFGGSVRKTAESILRDLGTDYLDVYTLFWLGVGAAWTEGTIEALTRLKEEGKVRAIGISTHDRERAGRLVQDSPLDLFMLRYNAAHPGAENDVFPHMPVAQTKKRPTVVAYTATSWRKLLKRPRGWTGPVMTAGDCYRFCLTSPHVDIALTGVKSAAELDDNMAAMEKGPLTEDEDAWMREFGKKVHG
jgi:predicted aldo/keto reductase-like oxidoreductase